jgi:hypothetical protein
VNAQVRRRVLGDLGTKRGGAISESRIDATISIARITLSDAIERATGGNGGQPEAETERRVIDLSPLVMAIWSL